MITAETIKPILDHILVNNINFGEQIAKSGIIIRADNGKNEGIKPRWGQVYAVGPDQQDVIVGDWLLIEHGRWSRAIEAMDSHGERMELFMIDPNGILIVSDHKPDDLELGKLSTVL